MERAAECLLLRVEVFCKRLLGRRRWLRGAMNTAGTVPITGSVRRAEAARSTGGSNYPGRVSRAGFEGAETDVGKKFEWGGAARLDALFFAPGTSQYYFTGVHWSEQRTAAGAGIPRTGGPPPAVPAFEEGRLREHCTIRRRYARGRKMKARRHWLAAALADRGLRTGRAGVEERVPFTFFTHLRQAALGLERVRAGGRDHNKLSRAQIGALTKIDAAGLRRDVRCISRGV